MLLVLLNGGSKKDYSGKLAIDSVYYLSYNGGVVPDSGESEMFSFI